VIFYLYLQGVVLLGQIKSTCCVNQRIVHRNNKEQYSMQKNEINF
jgi:hypothetical protein